jgi:hypothetical protein
MATGPVEDTRKHCPVIFWASGPQTLLKYMGLFGGELAQVYVMAVFKWEVAVVSDQVIEAGRTEEDEGQPIPDGVGFARLVDKSNGSQETIEDI